MGGKKDRQDIAFVTRVKKRIQVWQKVFESMVLSRAFGPRIGGLKNPCDEASKQSGVH
jgi:hypothetical protein